MDSKRLYFFQVEVVREEKECNAMQCNAKPVHKDKILEQPPEAP